MNMLKTVTYVLVLVLFSMLFGSIHAGAKDYQPFAGGSGTFDDPYLIKNVNQLQNVSFQLTSNFSVENDIDAGITSVWNQGQGFDPIGTTKNPFSGFFEGNGFVIRNLFICQSGYYNNGLFGTNDNVIQNVKMEEILIVSGFRNIGGIAGINNGEILNISVNGTIEIDQGDCCGGIVGVNEGVITNATFSGTVEGMSSIGGISGKNKGSIVECSSLGNVRGDFYVGGISGQNEDSIKDSLSEMNTTGLLGVGGITGMNLGTVINTHYLIDGVQINDGHHLTIGGLYEEQYKDWEKDRSLDIEDYGGTLVLSKGYYEISSLEGLRDLQGFADDGTIRFRLASDLDLLNYPGLFIPYFHCKDFDGNGHRISNASLNQEFAQMMGFFGHNKADISNLTLSDICIEGRMEDPSHGIYVLNSGGLVGYQSRGKISRCDVEGTISAYHFFGVGGLAGISYGTVDNCSIWITISNGRKIGGLVGCNYGSIENSSSVANLKGGNEMGGLVGYNAGTVRGSFSTGSCDSDGHNVGGLAGTHEGGNILDCYSRSEVKGSRETGGLIGNSSALVARCYSTGKVTGAGFAGGLIGVNHDMVEDCYWDNVTSGLKISGGGEGRYTGEMKKETTFKNWDFKRTWCIVNNFSYPFFGWQDKLDPVADAGPNLTTDEDIINIFDGRGSWDDFGVANYTWRSDFVSLYGARPSYIFENPGLYEFELTVRDATGKTGSVEFDVTVRDRTKPHANISGDRTVYEDQFLVLESHSLDNGIIVNQTWTIHDTEEIVILYGDGMTYNFSDPGKYRIELKVTDAYGLFDKDEIILQVKDRTRPVAVVIVESAVNEDEAIILDGSESSDNVGVSNWTWTIEIGDQRFVLYGPIIDFTFEEPGTYIINLNVSDNACLWDNVSFNIVVRDTTDPTISIKSVEVSEDTPIILDGSSCADNVGIVKWTWSFTEGDENVSLFGVSPTYVFAQPGIYTVNLEVKDAAGNLGSGSITIIVNDVTKPEIDEIPDRTVVEGSVVTLEARGSDNVGTVSWTWTFSDGIGNIVLYGQSVTHLFSKEGTHMISLEATDAAGNSMTDSFVLTVKNKETVAPPDGNKTSGPETSVLTFVIGGVVVVLLIIGIFAFFAMRKKNKPIPETMPETDEDTKSTPSEEDLPPTLEEGSPLGTPDPSGIGVPDVDSSSNSEPAPSPDQAGIDPPLNESG